MTEQEDKQEAQDDDSPLDRIEFALQLPPLMADGDLLRLLEAAADLNEDGSVPGRQSDEPDGPDLHRGSRKLYRDIAIGWIAAGRPRYVLSASMASLMVATKAPPVTDDLLATPYDNFVLEVPGEWTSLTGTGPLHILVVRFNTSDGNGTAVVASRRFERRSPGSDVPDDEETPDVCARVIGGQTPLSETEVGRFEARIGRARKAPAYFTEAVRYLVNTCCMLTAHQECSRLRTGKNAGKGKSAATIHDVQPPPGVSVTAEFRHYAKDLVASRRVSERKEALLHIVRGHWKRQVVGTGRSDRALIWIQPYQRGAESMGRIIEKTILVNEAPKTSTPTTR